MAEDQCLIQYVRDNFGHEFTYNLGDDDPSYAIDYNTFTESSTFANPSSPVPMLALNSFGSPSSPSLSTEFPSAMESSLYVETASGCYSSPGEPGLQVPSVFSNLDVAVDRPLPSELKNPMLASCGFAQPDVGLRQPQGCEGIMLNEMLQDPFIADSGIGASSVGEGDRASSGASSFWRGKTPALLMQQLKGPLLSSPSFSSEPSCILRSPSSHHPPRTQSPAPRTPLNLTSTSNCVGEFKSDSFGAPSPVVEPASKSRRLRSWSSLGDAIVDVKLKSILSPGHRGAQSSASFHGDHGGFLQQGNIMQRYKSIPESTVLGEMHLQRNAPSRNNSWSGSSTSPRSTGNTVVDHENNSVAANLDLLLQKNSCHSSMGAGDRFWKKAKAGGFQGGTVSEDAVQAAILATAMVEQKEKKQLREKFLALLQIDSSTSKDFKALILDDTIRYLKDLRRRLNINEADSTTDCDRDPDSGILADRSTEASLTTTSSRSRPCAEGLPSPVRLKELELETEGVEINPHLTVDSGPHIEVKTMENQHLMVKLAAKDRPGLFSDIVVTLRRLMLDIQHANIRTGNNGQRNDIFAAKMQLPFISSQSTHSIAMALHQVISSSEDPEPSISQILN